MWLLWSEPAGAMLLIGVRSGWGGVGYPFWLIDKVQVTQMNQMILYDYHIINNLL